MVLPRPEGGFFTTESPDRTYNTERGAKQAERMFQNPQRYQGWTRQGRQQQNTVLDTVIDEAEDFINDETGFDLDLNDNEEEFFEEAGEHEEEDEEWVIVLLEDILDIDSSHSFTGLSHNTQQNIRNEGSDGWVMSELITSSHGFYNGDMFHTVCYILDFSFEDAYRLFPGDFNISSNFPSVDIYREELEMLAEDYINS